VAQIMQSCLEKSINLPRIDFATLQLNQEKHPKNSLDQDQQYHHSISVEELCELLGTDIEKASSV